MAWKVESYKVAGRNKWRVRDTRTGRVIKDNFISKSQAQSYASAGQTRGSTSSINVGVGGTDVDFASINAVAGGMSASAWEQRLNEDAWRLIKGEWPPEVAPGKEVLKRVEEIKAWLATTQQNTAAASTMPTSQADWERALQIIAASGGGGGTKVIGGGYSAPPPPSTEEEIDAFVRTNYGYLAGYLQDPEIGPILRQAAKEGWDEGRLRGALHGTTWWQNTSESQREWDALWQLDRATANAQIEQRLDAVRRQAKALGLSFDGKKKDLGGFGVWDTDWFLAVTSLRNGWNPEQLAAAIFNEGGFDPESDYAMGSIASTADRVKALAKDYFVVIGNHAANLYAKQILMGEVDLAGIESLFRDQAKGRYGALAEQIDAGIRPSQFFDSYRQQIAAMLEVDADIIDLMDPQWSRVIEIVDSEGKRRPMTLAETADYVRSTPQWDRTDNAQREAMHVTELLGQTFGAVG